LADLLRFSMPFYLFLTYNVSAMKKYYFILVLSAALAAVNVPFSKYLLPTVPVMLLASLTYVGGAIGVGLVFLFALLFKKDKGPFLKGKDWLYILGVNVFDCAANTMLFYGIDMLNGETASLLQSFEIVATAILAFAIFKEKITWRLWMAIAIVLGASVLLSFNPSEAFSFNYGALLILGTTICWGMANNLAKKVADKDPIEYAFFKCLTPSIVLFAVAMGTHSFCSDIPAIALSLTDGFIAYGVSIILMMVGFRHLPVSLGTALYSLNPFLGAIFSIVIFQEIPAWTFYVAIVLVALGEGLAAYDGIINERKEKALPRANDPPQETPNNVEEK
jgi:drug/metabolite transporter (DMT)-like permease